MSDMLILPMNTAREVSYEKNKIIKKMAVKI